MMLAISSFQAPDEAAVIALWSACGLLRPWKDPYKDIRRKLQVQPDLFLVATLDSRVLGSVMAGYDGHRGWIYYLAVHPDFQRSGIGRQLSLKPSSASKRSAVPRSTCLCDATTKRCLHFMLTWATRRTMFSPWANAWRATAHPLTGVGLTIARRGTGAGHIFAFRESGLALCTSGAILLLRPGPAALNPRFVRLQREYKLTR